MASISEVKAKVDKMRSREYDAWRSNPANREEVALLDNTSSGSTPGFKRTDLSAKPTERYAVVRPCIVCTQDATVASDFQGLVICSESCQREYKKFENHVLDVQTKWADSEPNFYRCPYNGRLLMGTLESRGLECTYSNLKQVFLQLTAERKLLPPVSLKQLQAMDANSYNERERLDPALGGHKEAIEKKALASENQKRETEWAQPGFKLRPREAAMQAAATQELRVKAAEYENRGQVLSYKNGVPQTVPQTTGGLVTYRNGRRLS